MSHQEEANEGTGLSVVFDILAKAPPERLQSLTVQLGESPEDTIIRILCLVVLHREAEALTKLQELKDNSLAHHLSDKLHKGGNLEHFGDHCGHLEEVTGETLTMLARIFKVLCEQRLCDQHLRNLAYQRALSANGQKPSNREDLELICLFEEAKAVCGPQVHRSLYGGSTTLEVSLGQSERAHNLPSPLQAGSLEASYPSQLEISMPPTVSYKEDKIPRTPDESKVKGEHEANQAPGQCQSFSEPQSKSNQPAQIKAEENSVLDAASGAKSHTRPSQDSKPSAGMKLSISTLTNTRQPNMLVSHEMHDSTSAEEEEEEDEEVFYAFVILHAPEDVAMAESIKDRVEAAIGSGSRGAVFSENFAVPGRSTLKCVEDAINNSAFAFLLLTRNFNTRMLELETNSALINAIHCKHKYNTVIPLLPRKNGMPRESIPMVLWTIVPLEENDRLEGKIKKAMSPAKINRLKKKWTEEQRVKRQLERQDVLQQLNQTRSQLIQECKRAELLEKETMRLKDLLLGGDGQARPQVSNIHIENAQYIMIGNDSQMTVDSGGGADRDDEVDEGKEQDGLFSESA